MEEEEKRVKKEKEQAKKQEIWERRRGGEETAYSVPGNVSVRHWIKGMLRTHHTRCCTGESSPWRDAVKMECSRTPE